MASFFERFPRFLASSTVGAWPLRLELRHQAIFGSNSGLFEQATVLDLASHDGRWSFAALQAGAVHVTGVEARPALVAEARRTMEAYGVAASRYEFVVDDLNHQRRARGRYDVVLCLGYFYHTLNHLALMEYLASTGARNLVLDGTVEPGEAEIIRVYSEPLDDDANGLTSDGVLDGRMLVGHPTAAVLERMLRHHGYEPRRFDWAELLREKGIVADRIVPVGPDNPVGDYGRGLRTTIVAVRRALGPPPLATV